MKFDASSTRQVRNSVDRAVCKQRAICRNLYESCFGTFGMSSEPLLSRVWSMESLDVGRGHLLRNMASENTDDMEKELEACEFKRDRL